MHSPLGSILKESTHTLLIMTKAFLVNRFTDSSGCIMRIIQCNVTSHKKKHSKKNNIKANSCKQFKYALSKQAENSKKYINYTMKQSLFHLSPSSRVTPKLVNQPSSINSLQDFPFVVVSERQTHFRLID
ncbi:hypothetical protein NQD34_004670 [Periophthalmus magnuspinnatus]|nr:hypothetical protein NQD34_004670 [Periophthalmus magnuspinnatus]